MPVLLVRIFAFIFRLDSLLQRRVEALHNAGPDLAVFDRSFGVEVLTAIVLH